MSRKLRRSIVGAVFSLLAAVGLVAGTATTAHAAGPIYAVQLNWIIVTDNQDNNSVDEVYIKVNGGKVFGPHDCPLNVAQNLNVLMPQTFYVFSDQVLSIEFWDEDPGADDYVGTIWISGAAPPVGPNGIELSGSNGVYGVYYTVSQYA